MDTGRLTVDVSAATPLGLPRQTLPDVLAGFTPS
jgi:hypothetical protein